MRTSHLIISLWVLYGFGALAKTPSVQTASTQLFENAMLITMDDDQPDAFLGYMLIDEHGRISALGQGVATGSLSADKRIDLHGKIVAPGFISAHNHIHMSPLRGLGHQADLYQWYLAWNQYLQHTTPDDLYWFTLHGSVDFLRNGVTTAYDFTYPLALSPADQAKRLPELPDLMANQVKAKIDAGLRFVNSIRVWGLETDAISLRHFAEQLTWLAKFEGHPLFLKTAVSGAQQWYPSEQIARIESAAMAKHGLLNQTHLLETKDQLAEQKKKFTWYDRVGALGPQMVMGHFIHTDEKILTRAVDSGTHMSWQPTSNGRLGDGIADIVKYRKRGMKVAVGLDDQSCTDVADPFQNLRIGLYTIRALYAQAGILSIKEMLRMHTLGSAEVLGIEKDVGSLAVGKFADFLIVDLRDPDTGPIYEPLASYVLAASLRNLKSVYVGGVHVAEGTRMLGVDEAEIRRQIDHRTDRLRKIAKVEQN